jgi:hypothetical protein
MLVSNIQKLPKVEIRIWLARPEAHIHNHNKKMHEAEDVLELFERFV